METIPLSEKVKTARKAAGLTQFQVAAVSGVSLNTIRNIERGKNEDPLYSTVQALFTALEIEHDEQPATAA